jgi:hypothetical protein
MLKHKNKRLGSRGKKNPDQHAVVGMPVVTTRVPIDGLVKNRSFYSFRLPFEQVDTTTLLWAVGAATGLALPITMTPSGTLANICDTYRVIQVKITLTMNFITPNANWRLAVAYDPTLASALNYSAVSRYADSVVWSPGSDNPSLEILIKRPACFNGSNIDYNTDSVSIESANPWIAGRLLVAPIIGAPQNNTTLWADYEFMVECLNPRLL